VTILQKKLDSYFKSKDYILGRTIYKEYGLSETFKSFFAKNKNAASELLLHKCLTGLKENQDKLLEAAPKIVTSTNNYWTDRLKEFKNQKAKEVIDEVLSPEMESKRTARKTLYNQNRELHAQLKLMVSEPSKYKDDDRAAVSKKIIENSIKIQDIWFELKHPELVKIEKLPIKNDYWANIEGDFLAIAKAIQNTRTEISKAKKGILKKERLSELIQKLDRLQRMF
jgi:hypothetical protein